MQHDDPRTSEQAPSAADARPGSFVRVDDELVGRVERLLSANDVPALLALVETFHAADVARLIGSLDGDDAQRLFSFLTAEDASEVLIELDPDDRETVLEDATAARVASIVNELDTDDAADIVGDLDDDVAADVLPRLEDEDEIRELLLFAGDTAGGIMATEYVAVPLAATVGEATEEVRRQAEEVEDIYVVYVTDRDDRLAGFVTLKRLLLSPAPTPVESIMEQDFISVGVGVDQEEVARIMSRYDLVSLPVVDGAGRLVGRITIDDVIDVLREEANEDFQVISGSGDEGLSDSALRVSRGRLPWLVLGLGGTILSASVVSSFTRSLEQSIVLVSFIPIMTAMAGNAAIQSASITVQGLSSGRLLLSDAFRRVGKELAVALLNGLALSFLLGAAVVGLGAAGVFEAGAGGTMAMAEVARLALMATLALLSVIVLATVNGALIPVVLSRLGIDPAVSMGPFVTTANDILGLTVYFTIATLLFL